MCKEVFQRINENQAKSLLLNLDNKYDEVLTKQCGFRCYLFNTGQVLVLTQEGGCIYGSHDALLNVLSQNYIQESMEPWITRRGIRTVDYNNRMSFVRMPIEQLVEFLAAISATHKANALNTEVTLGNEFLLVFQLTGHVWSIVIHMQLRMHIPETPIKQFLNEFSRSQNVSVVHYAVSDSDRYIRYCLVLNGAVVETLKGKGMEVEEFTSSIRNISAEDIKDIWEFVDTFLREQDAYEPGLGIRYFLAPQSELRKLDSFDRFRPGDLVRIQNPGIISLTPDGDFKSTPEIKRLDYFLLNELYF